LFNENNECYSHYSNLIDADVLLLNLSIFLFFLAEYAHDLVPLLFVYYLVGMYQILIIDHTPTNDYVKEYSNLQELDGVSDQSIIKILWCPVKFQNKPFIDPVD
jgi:hypothetical protein